STASHSHHVRLERRHNTPILVKTYNSASTLIKTLRIDHRLMALHFTWSNGDCIRCAQSTNCVQLARGTGGLQRYGNLTGRSWSRIGVGGRRSAGLLAASPTKCLMLGQIRSRRSSL